MLFNIFMGLQYEQPWLKGQRSTLELIYNHCPIKLDISSENNDFGFRRFHKSTFKMVSI